MNRKEDNIEVMWIDLVAKGVIVSDDTYNKLVISVPEKSEVLNNLDKKESDAEYLEKKVREYLDMIGETNKELVCITRENDVVTRAQYDNQYSRLYSNMFEE